MRNNIQTTVMLALLIFLFGCKKECGEEGAEPCPCPACPVITEILPDHGSGGDTIRLIGLNFGKFVEGVDAVTINGVEAELTAPAMDNELSVLVPEMTGNGPVLVRIGNLTSDEVAQSPYFTYDYVRFDAIEPSEGLAGEVMFIYGRHFSPIAEENIVTFSGGDPFSPVQAEVLEASDTVLQVLIPEGAETGPVSIEVGGHKVEGPEFIYRTHLLIHDMMPEYGRKDDEIIITGEGFVPDPAQFTVVFAGGVEGEVTQAFEGQIAVKVPVLAGSGPITVSMGNLSGETKPFAYEYTATVSTVAGVAGVAGNTDGVGGKFYFPTGVTYDPSGALYVADSKNHKIRKVDLTTGDVSTYAGEGTEGFQDGSGHVANFHFPVDVTLDLDGNVYVADYFNRRIRKINSAHTVSTLAGNGTQGFKNGTGSKAQFDSPYGVEVDDQGNVFVADRTDHRIRKITPNGTTSTLAGSGTAGSMNGNGQKTTFKNPTNLSLGPHGALYISDRGNHQVREITAKGNVSTYAGMGVSGYSNGNGKPANAQFKSPYGIGVDANGNVLVADDNHRIRLVTPDGRIYLLAGNGQKGHKDGEGLEAEFASPYGMCMDAEGNFYIADSDNHVIRKITLE